MTRPNAQRRSPGDAKRASQAVWGTSPAGYTHAPHLKPGTREFFEAVLKRRSKEELPFLWEVFPFATTTGQGVLELGCGAGYDAAEFLRHGADYVGIDLTPENPLRTREHLEQLSGETPVVLQADVETLPFRHGSFDVAFSFGVLHHTPGFHVALSEAHRALRPGGSLWLAVYHRRSIVYWGAVVLKNHFLRGKFRKQTLADTLSEIEATGSDQRPLVRVYSKAEVASALRESGFEEVSVTVRKLNPEDLPKFGKRIWSRMAPVLDRIGRVLGWYVIATAKKPLPS